MVSKRKVQETFGHYINAATKQGLSVQQKASKRETTDAGRQRHEQINIAPVVPIAARHRTEEAKVFEAVPACQSQQFVSVGFDEGVHTHGIRLSTLN